MKARFTSPSSTGRILFPSVVASEQAGVVDVTDPVCSVANEQSAAVTIGECFERRLTRVALAIPMLYLNVW